MVIWSVPCGRGVISAAWTHVSTASVCQHLDTSPLSSAGQVDSKYCEVMLVAPVLSYLCFTYSEDNNLKVPY